MLLWLSIALAGPYDDAMRTRRYADFLPDLPQVDEASDDDAKARALYELASVQERLRDPTAAETAGRALALHDSETPLAEQTTTLLLQARVLAATGRSEAALTALTQARDLGPKLPDADRARHHNDVALLLTQLGRTDEAIREMERALARLDPEKQANLVSRVQHSLGGLYGTAGRLDDARAALTQTIALRTTLYGADDVQTAASLFSLGSVTATTSPVMLVDAETLELVPVLAEVDLQTDLTREQSFILRPMRSLDPATTYVVVLTDGLKTLEGESPAVSDGFLALRDDIPTDSDAVEVQRDAYVTVNATIDGLGLSRDNVVQAWSFTTRSLDQVVGKVLSMHDQMWAWEDFEVAIDGEPSYREDDGLYLYTGTMVVPDFMGEDLDIVYEDGEAIAWGTLEIDFQVTVPADLTEPRPAIAYGHGFFSDKEEANRSLAEGLVTWGMPAVSIDFHGFCSDDETEVLLKLTGPLSGYDGVVNQNVQAQAEFTAVARIIEEVLPELIELPSGVKPLDGTYRYMGISNGGTQGLSIVSASPAFDQGVLVVPGGGWSHMLQRAQQWNSMGVLLAAQHEEARDVQLFMALVQARFDPADSMNYVDHLLTDRFEGRKDVRVVLHEAVNDTQVANLVTHMVARTLDAPLATPSPLDIYGLEQVDLTEPYDGDAALFVYDLGAEDNPEGNVPPPEENGVHGEVRKLESYLEQVGLFLEDGTMLQVCDGPCDPD